MILKLSRWLKNKNLIVKTVSPSLISYYLEFSRSRLYSARVLTLGSVEALNDPRGPEKLYQNEPPTGLKSITYLARSLVIIITSLF